MHQGLELDMYCHAECCLKVPLVLCLGLLGSWVIRVGVFELSCRYTWLLDRGRKEVCRGLIFVQAANGSLCIGDNRVFLDIWILLLIKYLWMKKMKWMESLLIPLCNYIKYLVLKHGYEGGGKMDSCGWAIIGYFQVKLPIEYLQVSTSIKNSGKKTKNLPIPLYFCVEHLVFRPRSEISEAVKMAHPHADSSYS